MINLSKNTRNWKAFQRILYNSPTPELSFIGAISLMKFRLFRLHVKTFTVMTYFPLACNADTQQSENDKHSKKSSFIINTYVFFCSSSVLQDSCL